MIHPISVAVLRRPDLLARHLANHAQLIRAEFTASKLALMRKAFAGVMAGVSLLLALGLSATAFMLGALQGFHWALVAVPGVAWLSLAVCAVEATRAAVQAKAEDVLEQVEADLDLLRQVRRENEDD